MSECPHGCGEVAWCSICNGRDAAERATPKARAKGWPKGKGDRPRLDGLPPGRPTPGIEAAFEPQFTGARWERRWLADGRLVPTPGPRKPQRQAMRSRDKTPTTSVGGATIDQPGGPTAAETEATLAYRQRAIRRGRKVAAQREAAAKQIERNRQRAKARARRRGETPPTWAHKQPKGSTIRSTRPAGGAGS